MPMDAYRTLLPPQSPVSDQAAIDTWRPSLHVHTGRRALSHTLRCSAPHAQRSVLLVSAPRDGPRSAELSPALEQTDGGGGGDVEGFDAGLHGNVQAQAGALGEV